MEQRSRALLHRLIDAMNTTKSTDLQYLIQKSAPVVLGHLDRAHALAATL